MSNSAIISYLKVILGSDVEPDILNYITSMKHEEDYDEFMENIVVKTNAAHVNSYNAIKYLIFGGKKSIPQKTTASKSTANSESQGTISSKKEKKRFKDINQYQEKKKREGRFPCDCMGQEHEFMNNCVECGRIHCVEEGPGPCLFCGNMINFRGAEMLQNGSKPKNIMKHKQNKVFDDDNDYFKVQAKKNKEQGSKQRMIVALDFATRRVIEGSQEDAKIKERLLQDSIEHLKKVEEIYKNIQHQSEAYSFQSRKNNKVNDDLVNLLIQMRHKKPTEVEDLGVEDGVMPVIDYRTRVFDEEMLTSVDHGLCLSMHQPYASLLVAGVKRHEGRTWPTNHRGRLWIAAAAHQPDEDEVEALENFYRDYYKDPSLQFPKEYPTSCLLGCVNVDDCLDQETYRKKYPNGESNSPYVFICSNPFILPIFYPIAGKHKIYPLDKELHKCAKMALQYAKYAD